MRHRGHRGLGVVALTSAAVIGLSLIGTGTALAGGGHGGSGSPPGTTTAIASGLDNPRQLSFTPAGDLLVAESGKGGAGPCSKGPEGGTVCFGTSGAVTMIDRRGKQSRVLTGLPSIANQGDGAQASGPSDVVGVGRNLSILIGLGGNTDTRNALGKAGSQMGTLVETTWNGGRLRTIADLAAWEQANDPVKEEGGPDSNPVGLLYDCGRFVVADAGGNDVLRVSATGRIGLLAAFDNLTGVSPGPPPPDLPPAGSPIPVQAVPTSVAAKGYDGAYYVSQLTGFPFNKGLASIYRVDQWGHKTVYASGLTNVTDLAFDGRDLYAVQISTEGLLNGPIGSVVKVTAGSTSPTPIPGGSGLFAPYGIAIRNGSAYVTIGSVAAGAGQVIKIQL